MKEIFKEIKVVELASVLAGPAVGMFFAELGAQVVKIENKLTGGDMTRNWKLPNEQREYPISAYYASLNYGKEVLMANLKDVEDYRKVMLLIKEADIVLSNYLQSTANKLKVSYDIIRKINPKVIFGQIIGYHSTPGRPAFDAVLQAELGYISMNGTEDGQAAKMPVALVDVIAAHQLKEGILTALWHRERTGQGAYVEVALDESALSALVNQASNYLMTGHIAKRMGTKHPNIAPYGEIFKTLDGKEFILAIGADHQFKHLFENLNLNTSLEYQEFDTNSKRLKSRQLLEAELDEKISQMHSSQLFTIFDKHLIPFGVVRSIDEVMNMAEYQALVLKQSEEIDRKCVSSVAFHIFMNDANLEKSM
jgi:crotonobetainyl-CoA:carnitine CoA-transferase CaiB-like acyl-CoA transferase